MKALRELLSPSIQEVTEVEGCDAANYNVSVPARCTLLLLKATLPLLPSILLDGLASKRSVHRAALLHRCSSCLFACRTGLLSNHIGSLLIRRASLIRRLIACLFSYGTSLLFRYASCLLISESVLLRRSIV